MVLMSKVQNKLYVGIGYVSLAVCTHGLHHIGRHGSSGQHIPSVLQQSGCHRSICLHIHAYIHISSSKHSYRKRNESSSSGGALVVNRWS